VLKVKNMVTMWAFKFIFYWFQVMMSVLVDILHTQMYNYGYEIGIGQERK